MKDILKVFIYLTSILLCLIIVDYLGYFVLNKYFSSLRNGREYNTSLAVTEVKPDILFIGASQCQGNYNVNFFTEELGLYAYNAGMGAQHIDYQVTIANQVISRYKPKMIVWDLDPKLLANDSKVWLKMALNPHYNYSNHINNVLDKVDKYMNLKHYLKTYKYNSLIVQLFFYSRGKKEKSNGYTPFPCRNPKHMQIVKSDSYKARGDDTKRKAELMRASVIKWKKEGIQVVLVVSPMHKKIEEPIWGVEMAKAICEDEGIPFYDFTQLSPIYTDSTLFRDHIHLCNKGSKIYSNYFLNVLKSNL